MKLPLRNALLLLLMLTAAGLAIAMRPTHKISDQAQQIDLESMVPRAFGDWHEDGQGTASIVDPRTREMLDKLYSQTLSRTYVDADGYRVMLSIAYGNDQGDALQVHKPEICYPAQGFVLEKKQIDSFAFENSAIPVTRIYATLGQRSEPVTYWTTIGNQVVKPGGVNKKLAEMRYGLNGKIPDGMLIRVSSIDTQIDRAFQIQDRFSVQMLQAIAPENRQRLTGNLHLN